MNDYNFYDTIEDVALATSMELSQIHGAITMDLIEVDESVVQLLKNNDFKICKIDGYWPVYMVYEYEDGSLLVVELMQKHDGDFHEEKNAYSLVLLETDKEIDDFSYICHFDKKKCKMFHTDQDLLKYLEIV